MDGLKRFLRHRWTIRSCQIVIGIVFVLAALPKIGDLHSFATSVHNYRMLPLAAENLLAMTLPWIELVAGLALLLGLRARAGSALAAVLMVVFVVGVAQAVGRGLDFECGCFGTADGTRVGFQKLAENVVLTVVACIGALRSA